MKFEGIKKVILGAAVATAVAGVGVAAAIEYQNGDSFDPTGADRALNVNQVVFPDNESKTANQTDNGSDDSEMWQKDENTDEAGTPKHNDNADYLFESSKTLDQNSQENAALNPGTADAAGEQGGRGPTTVSAQAPDTVYDLTSDTARADTILSTGSGQTTLPGGNAGTADGTAGSDGNGTGSTATPAPSQAPAPTARPQPTAEPVQTAQPTAQPQPTAVPQPTATAVPQPTREPSYAGDTTDPDTEKKLPTGGYFPGQRYDEKTVDDIPEENRRPIAMPSNSAANRFYAGQILDAIRIFNMMDIGVFDLDSEIAYYWLQDDYNKYVRVTAISFDGGETWTSDFPVTIPISLEGVDVCVKFEYRLDQTKPWQEAVSTAIFPSESRVLVLDRKVPKGSTTIDPSWVLLGADEQYPDIGKNFGLFKYTQHYWDQALGGIQKDEYQDRLLPGWMEDGVLQPWLYPVTAGRHVLEPAATVPLDSDYGVQLRDYWISNQYEVTPDTTDNYGPLQTLTVYRGKTDTDAEGDAYLDCLTVPQYVQAVDMDYYPYLSVGTLDLPDTVYYVNTAGVKSVMDDDILYNRGLQVLDSYAVAADNPTYTAEDGLLYNKAKTQIVGLPVHRMALDVPDTVTKVTVPYRSRLIALTLQAERLADLPEVNYAQMADYGTVFVHDAIQDAFMQQQRGTLSRKSLYISSIEHPENIYRVLDNLAMTDDNTVHRALNPTLRQLHLPAYVTGLEAGCLQNLSNLETLYMPESGDEVTFEKDWAQGVKLAQIVCYTERQYKAAQDAAPMGVAVVMIGQKTVGDYTYLLNASGVELLSVSDTLTYFDGTVPTEEGSTVKVNSIGDGAFKDHTALHWVNLPEDTSNIGYQAFAGCNNLEGVLIGTTDTITIDYEAFAQCTALRFIASNAAYGEVRDEKLALKTDKNNDMLFCPTDAGGYSENWLSFSEDSNVASYALVDCGGTYALYGCGAGEDTAPWIMLRSGNTVNGQLQLPTTTLEIFNEAVRDARAADETYFTVNWDKVENEGYWFSVDPYAFENSDVGQDITLPQNTALYAAAFQNCEKLTAVTLPADEYYVQVGELVFAGCKNLTTAKFASLTGDIQAGLFAGCDQLTDIWFTDSYPPSTLVYGGTVFYFNPDWTQDEEAEKLTIHVPQNCENNYIETWRYRLAGYTDTWEKSAYQVLWDDVKSQLIQQDKDQKTPSNQTVTEETEKRLLENRNRIRKLLGMEPLTQNQRTYEYTVDWETNTATLTAVHNGYYVNLTPGTMEMPNVVKLTTIAANAFADSPSVFEVDLPETGVTIESGAFTGVNTTWGPLTLECEGDNIPELKITQEGIPFTFGIEDGSVYLKTNGGDEAVEKMILPMAGYSSMETLREAVKVKLTDELGREPTDEEMTERETQILAEAETRARTVLHMLDTEGGDDGGNTDLAAYALQTPETAITDTPAATPTPTATPAPTAVPEPTATPEPTAAPAQEDATPETAEKEG